MLFQTLNTHTVLKAPFNGIRAEGIRTETIKPTGIKTQSIRYRYRRNRQTLTSLLRAYKNGATGEVIGSAILRLAETGNHTALMYCLDKMIQ